MKIVSACLAGVRCNWQGEAKPCSKVINLVREGKAIPVCPEQLGGMTTPRQPSKQLGDKVISISGQDVTEKFLFGAKEGLKIAQLVNCKEAILKARSPSCGPVEGVFAKLLKSNGINVISEEKFL